MLTEGVKSLLEVIVGVMEASSHGELAVAAGVYVVLCCPVLLFVHALLCKGRKKDTAWLAATMPWSAVPLNYFLLLIAYNMVVSDTFWDYIKSVDPPYGLHVSTLVTAGILTLMALLPGLPLWRGASSLMKAVRLQRYFIAAAMLAGLAFSGTHLGGDSSLYAILAGLTGLQVFTALALLLACALRPRLVRLAPRRVAALRRKLSAGRIRLVMAALYALVALVVWQGTQAAHQAEQRAREDEREHVTRNIGQYLQLATSGRIGYAFIYTLPEQHVSQIKRRLAGIRRNPQGTPPNAASCYAGMVSFSFHVPLRYQQTIRLSLAHISPARSGDANVYTLPDEDYDALLALLRPLVASTISSTHGVSIRYPGKTKVLSPDEIREFKELCAELEWNAPAELVTHSYDAAVGSFEHELAFSYEIPAQFSHTIAWRDISPAGSGKNTPYTLPEPQYRRLYEWAQQLTAAEAQEPEKAAVPELQGARTWSELLGRLDIETLMQYWTAGVRRVRVMSPEGTESFELLIMPHGHWHADNDQEEEERSVMVTFTREGVRWAELMKGTATTVPEPTGPEQLTPWEEFDNWLHWLVARNQGWHRFVVFTASEDCPFSTHWRYFHALFTRFPKMEESHWEIRPCRMEPADAEEES